MHIKDVCFIWKGKIFNFNVCVKSALITGGPSIPLKKWVSTIKHYINSKVGKYLVFLFWDFLKTFITFFSDDVSFET